MISKFKLWWAELTFQWACRIIRVHGLDIVQIVERAGTHYLVGKDGKFYRIGRTVEEA